ncbi:MAG: hypothetical protein AAF601_10710 [Pseudomonadota bacterium]
MSDEALTVEMTAADLDMIEAALQTQEKILSVQSRAGGKTARARLNEVKGLLRRMRRQHPQTGTSARTPTWTEAARSLFSL